MNHQSNKNITGYILAGGKSSRMGVDKGLLLFNGEPLVLGIIKQLQVPTHEVIIIANNPEYKKFGLPVLSDLIPGIGPAGGIYTALQHSPSEKIFVTACDMPFINSAAVDYIIQHSSQAEITIPVFFGKVQPLFAVYSKNCLMKWKALIESGETRLQSMVEMFDLKKIPVEDNPIFDDLLFTNLNNKTDFSNALKSVENEN
ncbi:MAG: molybdenum cofactor guanylyltransferase [Chitinophagaceae bacterium]|nr:molybdenum cofactor guanylyltransferase [Chitinophagaceae bacterium]